MKYKLHILIFAVFLTSYAQAQSPQAIPYQAIARDSAGNFISNQNVSLRFSVHDVTAGGTIVYQETQSTTTNGLGLFSVNIGTGSVLVGTFSTIDWGGGSKYLQVEIDTAGGSLYVNMGTQQMLSVPYSLFSSNAAGAVTTVSAGSPLSSSGGTTPLISLTGIIPVSNGGTGTGIAFTSGSVVFAGSGGTYTQSSSLFWDNSNNRLGVGIAVPLERLHVSGNLRVSSLSGVGPRMVQANSNGNLMQLAAGTSTQVLLGTGIFGNVPTNSIWSLTGNSGTSDVSNFIGTTDNIPFNIRVNNRKSGKIDHLLFNTFFGYQSGQSVTTGITNTAVGFNSFSNNTGGNSNAALGAAALYSNTTGNYNTAIGSSALLSNTEGNLNTAVGYDALLNNFSGLTNTAIGANALLNNLSGNDNTAVGTTTLYSNTTANNNTAIGSNALYSNITGGNNTAVGTYALWANTSGSANTAIGSNALSANTSDFNTAVGNSALAANTYGFGNTAHGYGALYSNITGNNNTGSGYQALFSNTSGSDNTAYGASALFGNTDGVQNTAVGYNALVYNSNGSENTAVGRNALYANNSGSNNTAVGNNALQTNYSGLFNTAIGHNSLKLNFSGQGNTAAGYNAQAALTTGTYNTSMGISALEMNSIGFGNSAFGAIALALNIAGNNTAIGYSALASNTTGLGNVASGSRSLFKSISGSNNVAVGYEAGFNDSTGSGNVFLGYQAGYFENGSNKLYIANSNTTVPLIFGNFSTSRIGFGTNSPMTTVHTIGNIFIDNSGSSHGLSGNPALTVDGAASEDVLRLRSVGANVLLAVRSDGNTGIGISTPSSTLEVNGGFATKLTKSSGTSSVTLGNNTSVYYIITAIATTNFPAANTCENRRYIVVNRSGADRTTGNYTNLTGAVVNTIASNTSIEVISDGTDWLQIK